MRLRGILSLLLIILAMLACSVTAVSIVDTEIVKNQISPHEQAEYKLSIINKKDTKQRYSIYSFVQGWIIDPSPLKDKIIELEPGQDHTTSILIKPKESFPPGVYHVSLNVESDSGERYSKNLKVYLKPDKPVDYLPSLKVDLDMDEKITPK